MTVKIESKQALFLFAFNSFYIIEKEDLNMQKEIGKNLIMIRKLMDFFDDGHHLKEIGELTKMSNELFEKLTEPNQEKFKIWLEKR